MRLIDADALLDKQESLYMKGNVLFHGVTAYSIENAPTIDPESMLPKEEWISVKDSLPQATEYVLIYDSHYRNIYKAWYVGDIDVWFSNEYLPQFINITHWMPLPKPPKES